MDKKTLMDNIQSFVKKAGYYPLDLKLSVKNDALYVSFAIFKRDAHVSINDCASVTKIVRDFLNMLLGKEADFIVDVSSPGAERRLKDLREYVLFAGKKARIVTKAETILTGYLRGVEKPETVLFECEDTTHAILFSDIVKCRLVIH